MKAPASLGPREITLNAVALVWFDTGLGAHFRRNEQRGNDIVDHTSLGRWGTAEDLPGAYLFLASAASAYISGTTLTVDGGYSLKYAPRWGIDVVAMVVFALLPAGGPVGVVA